MDRPDTVMAILVIVTSVFIDIRRVYQVHAQCDELADLNDASRRLIEAAHRVWDVLARYNIGGVELWSGYQRQRYVRDLAVFLSKGTWRSSDSKKVELPARRTTVSGELEQMGSADTFMLTATAPWKRAEER
jgi:hypothetical protein